MTMKVNRKHSCGLMEGIICKHKNNFMMAGKWWRWNLMYQLGLNGLRKT